MGELTINTSHISISYTKPIGRCVPSLHMRLAAQGYAFTRSGSIYKLLGTPQHDEPDFDDLACLCAVMNQWGLGKYLGIPPFFY